MNRVQIIGDVLGDHLELAAGKAQHIGGNIDALIGVVFGLVGVLRPAGVLCPQVRQKY